MSTGSHRHASPIWVAPDRATPPHSAAPRGIAARARSPCGALQTARMVTARADGAPVPDRPEVAMQHHNRIAPIILGVWPSWAQAARVPTRPKACPSRRQHHHAQPQRCAYSCPAPAGLYRRPPYGAALCHRATAMRMRPCAVRRIYVNAPPRGLHAGDFNALSTACISGVALSQRSASRGAVAEARHAMRPRFARMPAIGWDPVPATGRTRPVMRQAGADPVRGLLAPNSVSEPDTGTVLRRHRFVSRCPLKSKVRRLTAPAAGSSDRPVRVARGECAGYAAGRPAPRVMAQSNSRLGQPPPRLDPVTASS